MNTKCVNVFVLGAGASVDYGLPVWSELRDLLKIHIKNDGTSIISADFSNRFLEKLDEVGEDKKYPTVDEMISEFARTCDAQDQDTAFRDITRKVFNAIKQIFQSRIRTECVGWIETFVEKNNIGILLNGQTNQDSNNPSVFVNYNYDSLLLLKIVEIFKTRHVDATPPDRAEFFINHGRPFEEKFGNCAQAIFHPHGILYLHDRDETKIGRNTFCQPIAKTCLSAYTSGYDLRVSTSRGGNDNAVSCKDAMENFTFPEIKSLLKKLARDGQGNAEMKLIVLGVGPDGLEYNLGKIFGGQDFNVTEIHYTCTEECEKECKDYIYGDYLNEFNAITERYKDCQELVEENVFIPFD